MVLVGKIGPCNVAQRAPTGYNALRKDTPKTRPGTRKRLCCGRLYRNFRLAAQLAPEPAGDVVRTKTSDIRLGSQASAETRRRVDRCL